MSKMVNESLYQQDQNHSRVVPDNYLLKAFKAEVDKERLKLLVRGDWYGKSRDQKTNFPLASNKMTDK